MFEFQQEISNVITLTRTVTGLYDSSTDQEIYNDGQTFDPRLLTRTTMQYWYDYNFGIIGTDITI